MTEFFSCLPKVFINRIQNNLPGIGNFINNFRLGNFRNNERETNFQAVFGYFLNPNKINKFKRNCFNIYKLSPFQ